jgi:hypothetical protein
LSESVLSCGTVAERRLYDSTAHDNSCQRPAL